MLKSLMESCFGKYAGSGCPAKVMSSEARGVRASRVLFPAAPVIRRDATSEARWNCRLRNQVL